MNGPPPAHHGPSSRSSVTLGDGIGGLGDRGLKRVGDEAPLTNSTLTISTGQGLGNNQTSNNGGVTKRPRVRDYVGSRGGNRHMIADLGQRLSPTLSSLATSSGGFSSPFAAALHQQQLLAAATAAAAAAAAQAAATGSSSRHSSFPLVKPPSTHERDVTLASNSCDKTKDRFLRHSLPTSMVEVTEDTGAPLDLCIKKPRDRDGEQKAPSPSRSTPTSSSLFQSSSFPMSAVQHLEDVSRRLSESSEGSSSSIFPKKRGRKPKSLLANATLPSATVTSSTVTPLALLQQHHQQQQQLHQQQLQANEPKPRKRGRPPLMSPPPNIDVSGASSSSSKFLNPQDILQATILAQQQLAAAQAARWSPLFPTGQLMMPNGMREALAHLYTNSLQQAAAAGASTSNSSASRGLPTTSSSSGFDSLLQKPSDSAKVEVTSVDSDSDDEDSSKPDDFKPGTSAEDIRIPLKFGWRRYTIINRISSSGVKGDVVYISPEGKKLRTLNDIQKVSKQKCLF